MGERAFHLGGDCLRDYDSAREEHDEGKKLLTEQQLALVRERTKECFLRAEKNAKWEAGNEWQTDAMITQRDGFLLAKTLPQLESLCAAEWQSNVVPEKNSFEAWKRAASIQYRLGSKIERAIDFLASPEWVAVRDIRMKGDRPPGAESELKAAAAGKTGDPRQSSACVDRFNQLAERLREQEKAALVGLRHKTLRFLHRWLLWQYGGLPIDEVREKDPGPLPVSYEVPANFSQCQFLAGPRAALVVHVTTCEVLGALETNVKTAVPWYEKGYVERWVPQTTKHCYRTQPIGPGTVHKKTTWEYGEQVTRVWTVPPAAGETCLEFNTSYQVKDETRVAREETVDAMIEKLSIRVSGQVELQDGTRVEQLIGRSVARAGMFYRGQHVRRDDLPNLESMRKDLRERLDDEARSRVPTLKSTELSEALHRVLDLSLPLPAELQKASELSGMSIESLKEAASFSTSAKRVAEQQFFD